MHFWYQQGNKTLPGLYFQWGCWDTNQSDLVQALKHSVQVRKKLKCTILLHSCKMFRRLVEGIRCWRWTEDGCNKGGCEFSHFCWLKQEVNGGRDPTTNRQNKCWHCALCTNHGLPFSFFAALLHKGLTTSPGVLKMIRCVTWSAAGHVVRNNWNHGCIFCHFIYYLTFYSSGKMTCLAVSCFMERSLCWDIFLTTCWYLLGMERIKEETSELYFCSRLFSFFLLFFEIQSRTNSTASLNNTEYILCSSSLLQYNLNVHLLDTHYSPTWSNGYESIGLTKKDSQSLKSRRWSSSEVWKPAIESETRRERRHISDPTAERKTRWHAVRRWHDLTSGRPADDKQRRS